MADTTFSGDFAAMSNRSVRWRTSFSSELVGRHSRDSVFADFEAYLGPYIIRPPKPALIENLISGQKAQTGQCPGNLQASSQNAPSTPAGTQPQPTACVRCSMTRGEGGACCCAHSPRTGSPRAGTQGPGLSALAGSPCSLPPCSLQGQCDQEARAALSAYKPGSSRRNTAAHVARCCSCCIAGSTTHCCCSPASGPASSAPASATSPLRASCNCEWQQAMLYSSAIFSPSLTRRGLSLQAHTRTHARTQQTAPCHESCGGDSMWSASRQVAPSCPAAALQTSRPASKWDNAGNPCYALLQLRSCRLHTVGSWATHLNLLTPVPGSLRDFSKMPSASCHLQRQTASQQRPELHCCRLVGATRLEPVDLSAGTGRLLTHSSLAASPSAHLPCLHSTRPRSMPSFAVSGSS